MVGSKATRRVTTRVVKRLPKASAEALARSTCSNLLSYGAARSPRSTKLGNNASPWRYDVTAEQALESPNLQGPAILRYT
jgi:hypothetical protein